MHKPSLRPRPALAQKMAGAVRAPLPEAVTVQLATLSTSSPVGEDWISEIKLDGYRLVATVDGGRAKLTSRNGNDWTHRFSQLAGYLGELSCKSAIMDGEAVIIDKSGISRFQRLQNALSREEAKDVVYYAFDLLFLDGYDLRGCELVARKERLQELLQRSDVTHNMIRYSDHVRGGTRAFYSEACRVGLEGIVCKLANSPYTPGRSRSWLKVKCLQRQEFVVVGFTDPSGSRKGLGALLLGVYQGDDLLYCGKVGTGFSATTLDELYARFKPLVRSTPPVLNAPRGAAAKGVHWVKPEHVAEVAFTEWTEDGAVRHPSFAGLRLDKAARQVVRERPIVLDDKATQTSPAKKTAAGAKAVVAGIRISHPEKLLYPEVGVTKLDLVLYYEHVAALAVPYLRSRPLTLLRCPDGYERGCFFQKHGNAMVPKAVPRVTVKESGQGKKDYLTIDGLSSLIQLVQMGVMEFHVWGSRAEHLETPDIIVFDLDPGPAAAWKDVIITALALRERLAGLGLASFARFTGGKGIHVVVPLVPRASWDEVKGFSLAIAEDFVRRAPLSFTAKLTKRGRESKILIDYLRNGRDATAVASYSARARPGAPVALPVRWEHIEASAKAPMRLSIKDAPRWLDKLGEDPWIGFDAARKPLTKKILTSVGP